MSTTTANESAVTLEMINELQQQVLDNNPIYKYLLSEVSSKCDPVGDTCVESHITRLQKRYIDQPPRISWCTYDIST